MPNSTGNLFILAIILGGIACYFLDIKNFLKNNLILRKIVKRILPKTKSREYKSLNSLLRKSSLNMDMLDLYIVKIAVFLLASVILFLIFITNTQVKQEQIFETPVYSSYLESDFHNNPSVRLKNFNLLKSHINITEIDNSSSSLKLVKDTLTKYSDISSDELNDSAAVSLKDITSIKSIYSFSRKVQYILCAAMFFFMPDLLLKIYSSVIVKKKEEEVYNLVNLIIVVSSNPNITSRNILKALIENSHYLNSYLRQFESNYLVNRTGAYDKFLNDENYKCISKIVSALRQIEESDKTSAVYNLESENESIEKSRKINYENKIEKKEGIAFVIFIVGVCILIKIIMDVSIAGISNMGSPNL